jgi:hypothetical protein
MDGVYLNADQFNRTLALLGRYPYSEVWQVVQELLQAAEKQRKAMSPALESVK